VVAMPGLGITELTMRSINGFSLYASRVAETHAQTAVFIASFVKAGFAAGNFSFVQKWADLCVPASAMINVAIAFVFSLVMLGRLLAWREALKRTPVATPYRFRFLSLPEWLLFAFVIGGLSPLASGMVQQVGANVLAVAAFLYFLQGVAIFRTFVAATGAGVVGSLFAWTILGLLTVSGIAPVPLCIVGLFDSFFDFRHFNRKDHSDESHSH